MGGECSLLSPKIGRRKRTRFREREVWIKKKGLGDLTEKKERGIWILQSQKLKIRREIAALLKILVLALSTDQIHVVKFEPFDLD